MYINDIAKMEEVLKQTLSISTGVGFPSIVQSKSSFLVPSLNVNSSPLKIKGWHMNFLFGAFRPVFKGVLVRFREGIHPQFSWSLPSLMQKPIQIFSPPKSVPMTVGHNGIFTDPLAWLIF